MRLWCVLAITACMLVDVSGQLSDEARFCFKCAANPECVARVDPANPSLMVPVSSANKDVYLSRCKGTCYVRRLTHIAAQETLVYRGCYERDTDCVPGCFGNAAHTDCVKCCKKNMCNSARAVTFSLPIILVTLAVKIILQ